MEQAFEVLVAKPYCRRDMHRFRPGIMQYWFIINIDERSSLRVEILIHLHKVPSVGIQHYAIVCSSNLAK